MRRLDLTGQRFGFLVAIEPAPPLRGLTAWRCLCDCGAETIALTDRLKRGGRKSCGCRAGFGGGRPVSHGHCRKSGASPEWQTWNAMLVRCSSPGAANYQIYGGRGIKVCDRWRDGFEAFLADMGPRPSPKHSLDRIDPNGNYEPGNCRWATAKEQAFNRRNNKLEPHEQGQIAWLARDGRPHAAIAAFFGISTRYVRKLMKEAA
jgi:hypothetical protein